MPCTPDDLLLLAKELVAAPRESDHRSGASRAYYAGFHAYSQLAFRQGFKRKNKRSAHRELVEYFTRYTDSDAQQQQILRQLGRTLEQARVVRVEADYELETDFLQEASQVVASLIESAMDDLRKL